MTKREIFDLIISETAYVCDVSAADIINAVQGRCSDSKSHPRLLVYAQGTKQHGAHWTLAQVVSATQGMSFSKDVNDYDKYVAFNAAYSDLCKKFDDSQILDAAYLLYFADEDWHDGKECTKIWEYMNCAR